MPDLSAIFHPGTRRFHPGTGPGRPVCSYATAQAASDLKALRLMFWGEGAPKLSPEPSGVARVDKLPRHQVAFYKLNMKICRRDI